MHQQIKSITIDSTLARGWINHRLNVTFQVCGPKLVFENQTQVLAEGLDGIEFRGNLWPCRHTALPL